MRSVLQRLALTLVVSLTLAGTAAAQAKPAPPRRPPQPQLPMGIAGSLNVGFDFLSAADSLDAVSLDSRQTEIGGSGRITNVWRRLFIEVGGSRWSATGERAFVDEAGVVYPLGIPLDVSSTHIDITAGWRFAAGRSRLAQRFTPYVGGGIGFVSFKESSPFAQAGDDFSERVTSSHVLGGVEYRLAKWISVAGEARYRHVPELIGEGGVSDVLGDDTFSGTSALVRIVVGR